MPASLLYSFLNTLLNRHGRVRRISYMLAQ